MANKCTYTYGVAGWLVLHVACTLLQLLLHGQFEIEKLCRCCRLSRAPLRPGPSRCPSLSSALFIVAYKAASALFHTRTQTSSNKLFLLSPWPAAAAARLGPARQGCVFSAPPTRDMACLRLIGFRLKFSSSRHQEISDAMLNFIAM